VLITMLVGSAFYNGLRVVVERSRVDGVWGYRIGFSSAVVFCIVVLAYLRRATWRSLGRQAPPLWSDFFSQRDRGGHPEPLPTMDPPWDGSGEP
jgi:hypothetical protein